MAKPKRNRYSGIAVYANGYVISRAQSFSSAVDLGDDEARELSNPEVVEFSAQNPQVTLSLETNEYGSCRNLRAIAGVTGGSAADNITVNSFDGSVCDIGVMVEQDNVLSRTAIHNQCYLTSISWNYDVGGVATETFNFETDNKTWYANTYKEAYSVIGISPTLVAGVGTTIIAVSGFGPAPYQTNFYAPLKVYIDGIAVTGTVTATGLNNESSGTITGWAMVKWTDSNFTSTGSNYRVIIVRTGGSLPTTLPNRPSTSTLGSVTRGKLDISLVTGANDSFSANGTTDFLRLQTVSIDADLSREVLNELGHYRAFDRSLTLPVPVNVTFSALSSDLQDWAKFSTQDGLILASSYSITDFVSAKQAKLQVRIFDKNDTVVDGTRTLKKSLTVTGLQIVSETFSIDVGSNATQDFTAKTSNFLASGLGTPGKFPLTATPTD